MPMTDVRQLLLNVISEYSNANKWTNSTFGQIKQLSNTHVGDIGQVFIERLCSEIGFECEFFVNAQGNRVKQGPWDVKIEGVSFELKTATEDVSYNFQFNHIRHHRAYDAVLCVGISPDAIHFNAWSKADVATGRAGSLVTMDRGSSATFKLTKRADQLLSIDRFEQRIRELVAETAQLG